MPIDISVLIPVYNVESYIYKCLSSIFNNTYISHSEVIIVNDCSTDSSMEIAKKIIQEHQNIRVKIINHNINRGLASARNTGLEAANGKYIICVDSDDWVEPDYLETLYLAAEEKNADIIMCDFFYHQKNNNTSIIKNPSLNSNIEYLKHSLHHSSWTCVWFCFIKRSLFINNNLHWKENVNIAEDHYIIQRLLCYASNIYTVNKPLYHYNYTNSNSMTYNIHQDINLLKKSCIVAELNYNFFKKQNIYDSIRTEVELSILELKIEILKLSNILNYKKEITFSIQDYNLIKENLNLRFINRLFIYSIAKKKYFISDIIMLLLQIKRNIKNAIHKN